MKNVKSEFPKALKSFVGHLEGTGKARHTIVNYRLDLLSFASFLEGERPRFSLREIPQKDLERFQDHLKQQGLRTNTRRRKVLTVSKFLRYLAGRNKVDASHGKRVPAPQRVERVPFVLPFEKLSEATRKLPQETGLDRRNRLLLWTLLETGALVSEVARLRFEQVQGEKKPVIRFESRDVAISEELARDLRSFESEVGSSRTGSGEWVFHGFTRGGPLVGPISPRGVELLVRAFARTAGFRGRHAVTPRTFRHSRVVDWLKQDVARPEIQRRLGLRTAYTFRTLEPLLNVAESGSDPLAKPHPSAK